jgi:hypothetical protein
MLRDFEGLSQGATAVELQPRERRTLVLTVEARQHNRDFGWAPVRGR